VKLTEQEIEALERGIAEDKSRISYLEQRVKALEEALTESILHLEYTFMESFRKLEAAMRY
jgi:wobble nucleotide-excising tRNase